MSRGWVYPADVKAKVIAQFDRTWKTFASPSAAAAAIGKEYGVSKTTVYTWVADAGRWPVTRASRVLELEEENARLREELRLYREACSGQTDA
nr:transposase [Corynebacterium lactis]